MRIFGYDIKSTISKIISKYVPLHQTKKLLNSKRNNHRHKIHLQDQRKYSQIVSLIRDQDPNYVMNSHNSTVGYKKDLENRQRTSGDLFQRRHASGQQLYEKMIDITNSQGNVNRNNHEIPSHIYQNGYSQKDQKQQLLVRKWRKMNPWALVMVPMY